MARDPLAKNTDEKITSDASGVPGISPKKRIPIYPAVISKGGHAWQFQGLDNSEIFPSPTNTGWRAGWVNKATRNAMIVHPKVSSALNLLKNAVAGDGPRCVPNISPYGPDKDSFPDSDKIARFCDHVLRETGNFHQATRQMCDMFQEGNKVAPLDFSEIEAGKHKGKVGLDEIVVWPNEAYEFFRDETGRTTFLRVRTNSQTKETDFPRRKFWVNTYRPLNNDPNGTLVLAAAYLPFYRDIQINYDEMAYMATFSRPSVVIFAAPPPEHFEGEETPQPLKWADGTPVMEADPENPGQMRQREGYITEQNKLMFVDFQAGSIWSMAGGSEVQVVQASPGGAELFSSMREANAREIHGVILGSYQATESEKNQSGANQNVGEGIIGFAVTEGKLTLEKSTERDVLTHIVRMNFGKAAARDFLPIVDFGSGENGRVPQVNNSIVGFVNGGAFTKDQWWWWCVARGLPLPYPGEAVVSKAVMKPVKPGGGDKSSQKQKPVPAAPKSQAETLVAEFASNPELLSAARKLITGENNGQA